MARVKISEFRAKSLVCTFFGIKYKGIQIKSSDILQSKFKTIDPKKLYVLKVDEGIKKRGKQGLIFVKVKKTDLSDKAKIFFSKGYNQLLLEEFVDHDQKDEKYLSVERTRNGLNAYFSNFGGINIENHKNSIENVNLKNKSSYHTLEKNLELNKGFCDKLLSAFETNYFSFLEINPLLSLNGEPAFLDLAVEVDDAAVFAVNNSWSNIDFVDATTKLTPEEKEVNKLGEGSTASLKLKVLNPKGSIFTIFSGGGASIVLADEIGNIGKANELVNYAEYSGGPNEEETYLFTKQILSLVKKSKAKNKVIYIAGGVANFTDIRETFKGVIKALSEDAKELSDQKVKVYVRRGGPYQSEGLKMMETALKSNGILGRVVGPEEVLTSIIIKK